MKAVVKKEELFPFYVLSIGSKPYPADEVACIGETFADEAKRIEKEFFEMQRKLALLYGERLDYVDEIVCRNLEGVE